MRFFAIAAVASAALAAFAARADEPLLQLDAEDIPTFDAGVTVVAGSEANLPRGKTIRFVEGAHSVEENRVNKKILIGIGKLLNTKRMKGCTEGNDVTVQWNVLMIDPDDKIAKAFTAGFAGLGDGVLISARFRDSAGRELLQIVGKGSKRWGTGLMGGGENKAARRAGEALADFATRVCTTTAVEPAPVALQAVPTPGAEAPAIVSPPIPVASPAVPPVPSGPSVMGPAPVATPTPLGQSASDKADTALRLEKLGELRTKGLITEQEYQAKRREILEGL